jgi:hydrogenase expression/formation protein HypD
MKFIEEYRDPQLARQLADSIKRIITKSWKIMEICGGQTHAIVKYGIDELLPSEITMVHGPGCPVCVTPLEVIDRALAIASHPNVIFCSFGDMLRVPGSKEDLFSIKAKGGDVRIVYSPLDTLKIALDNPDKEVVFFGVGFETTAPTTAMAVHQASLKNIENFSLLVSHVLVPPAMEAILSDPNNRVQGFLAAGHVCTVMGYKEYRPLAKKYGVPIVVTGFEPVDILRGVFHCIKQLEDGRAEIENAYNRVVRKEGNVPAQELIKKVFCIVNQKWRGIGEISSSGLGLRKDFQIFDAEKKFAVREVSIEESSECIAGLVLRGIKKPNECTAFALNCTPEYPLGAPMVSSEGACAAYYRYRKAGQEVFH